MIVGDLVKYKEQSWDCFRDEKLKDGSMGIITKSRPVSNRTVGTTYMCEVYFFGYGYPRPFVCGIRDEDRIKPLFANNCLEKINESR